MNKKQKPSVYDFSGWLDKMFAKGRINNISKTQHWIDVFLREITQKEQEAKKE